MTDETWKTSNGDGVGRVSLLTQITVTLELNDLKL